MDQDKRSLAGSLALLPEPEREKILSDLSDDEILQLEYDWKFWARHNQLAPEGDWQYWLLLAGRCYGKTRTGAEWVRERVGSGNARRIALVAPTDEDAREIMVEGESGILSVCPPWNRPVYDPKERRLTWPNGAIALLYSAEEPDGLRGSQHDTAWCDEMASWRYPDRTWDLLHAGFKPGKGPKITITTTPRPIPLIKNILNDSRTHVTRGSSYENLHNLEPDLVHDLLSRYEGTRLGRQELNAELLDDNPDALWTQQMIEDARVSKIPKLVHTVVGVDHAISSNDTGIIVAAVDEQGDYYVLADNSTTADNWEQEIIEAYYTHLADQVVGESNSGAELVGYSLQCIDSNVHYGSISIKKHSWVDPISSLYEQGKVHYICSFPILEDMMCDQSLRENNEQNRVSALVWALLKLSRSRIQTPDLSALIRTRQR